MNKKPSDSQDLISHENRFVFDNIGPEGIESPVVFQYLKKRVNLDSSFALEIHPEAININQAVLSVNINTQPFLVTLIQQNNQFLLFCNCQEGKICSHQESALRYLLQHDDLQLFFNQKKRHENLKEAAYEYGLENESDLDKYFQIEFRQNRLDISPIHSGLIPITAESLRDIKSEIHSQPPPQVKDKVKLQENIVVLRQHKYYHHLLVELYHTERTKGGKIKNPLTVVNPQEYIWSSPDAEELKFFMGISRFQNLKEGQLSMADIHALKAVINNPLRYSFYYHDSAISEKVSSKSLAPIQIKDFTGDISLVITKSESLYEISAKVTLKHSPYPVKDYSTKFDCFLFVNKTFYLVDKLPLIRVLNVLKQRSGKLLIHASGFNEFKSQLLNDLENHIKVDYQYIAPATPEQLTQKGFDKEPERMIYLSDFGNFIMIIPVLRYGGVEVAIRSDKQVYGIDDRGKEFRVKRDDDKELAFTALLVKQHPFFEEQVDNGLHYFYLHRKRFLEEEWFLKTFEEWEKQNIMVLGFDKLEGNKLNPHKVKIDIKINSGLNWFNAETEVRFGKKKASLKQVRNAVQNKSKYVKLGDGTYGVLPEEWMEKFNDYFNAGEISKEDLISIPKVNFSEVERLFESEMLDTSARQDLELYRNKLNDFTSIKKVKVPKALKGKLRNYQKEGLNWLNFLDEFNFGGCLADDMGLGKSIQILAFILLQREKVQKNTNLLIVPTTLIFNWKAEIEKFAPDIKLLILQGADRIKNTEKFEHYEVILISYNTLLTDITYLKKYEFNYIFLDESQQIKNPESQRYKAAKMLKSRNKIVITGTPVENNTFDLFSQFSFACPGLFGNKRHFKELYAVPIDQFKESKRAIELQEKIKPFLLRRTKQQVAQELPEKTEIVLYCEMNKDQRRIYDQYEEEIRNYISSAKDEEIKKSSMYVLKGLTKLRQICNSPKILGRDDITSSENSSKIDMLLEQIEDNADHHKMLVFSQFVSMLDLIKKELIDRGIGFVMLTGSTKNREAVVNKFQKDEDIRVFLISLKAGGTGLNLTEASYVYLVDPWWNPAVENQAIDRSYRIGQNKNVTAIRLICPDTVEEKIMTLQKSKKDLADNLITDDSSILKSFTKNELLKLLR